KINLERIEKKVIGAMKQSKSYWKCKINPLSSFKKFLGDHTQEANAFIAFVETGKEDSLQKQINTDVTTTILIGPEGDFTNDEVNWAKESGYIPVNLGQTILRTETAGVIAAHTVNLINQY
ncbi:MAG: RsmE family RNA methyltransferase, partial [Reichenbachiella sp.]